MKTLSSFIILMFFGLAAHAAPDSFVYEGYISNGGTAITDSNATLNLKIRIPGNAACVLYSKDVTGVSINNGYFAVRIDNAPTIWFDNTAVASSVKFRQIFQAGTFANTATCAGGGTANATDRRELYITYQAGTNPVFGPISLEAVPFATISSVAETAKDISPAANLNFGAFKITNLADPTAAQDAATKSYVDSTSSNANNLSSGSVPVARIPTGTAVGNIVAVQAGGQLPALDGSALTALNPASISGAVAVAHGGTGQSATPANGNLLIGNGTNFSLSNLTAGAGVTITNGPGSITIAASGSGITSIDGDSTAVQSFALGTSGLLPAWGTAAGVHTLSLPMASAAGVTAGLLNKTDYDIFTGKLSAVAGSPLVDGNIWIGNVSNAAAAGTISGDATLSNTGTLTIANSVITSAKIANGTISSADIAAAALSSDSTKFFAVPQQNTLLATSNVTGATIVPFTCSTDGYTLTWTATTGWGCSASGGGGTVTSITAGTGLIGGPITTSGTFAVDVGTTANKILKLDASAKIPAVDGSQLTGLGPNILSSAGASNGQTLTWNGSIWEASSPSAVDATKLPLAGGSLTGAVTTNSNVVFSTAGSAAANLLRFGSAGTGFYGDSNGIYTSVGSNNNFSIGPSAVSVTSSQGLHVYPGAGNHGNISVGVLNTTQYASLNLFTKNGNKNDFTDLTTQGFQLAGGNDIFSLSYWDNGSETDIMSLGAGFGQFHIPMEVVSYSPQSSYASSSAAVATPDGFGVSVSSNDTSNNNNGAMLFLKTGNSSGKLQNGYFGAVSTSGGAAYTPSIVIGQQTGLNAYSERMRIDPTGNVGIGTTTPAAKLEVMGSINAASLNINAGAITGSNVGATGGTTFDFAVGNVLSTTSNCTGFTFNNLKSGSSYTFIVKGTSPGTCTFLAYSGSGTTGPLTVRLPPDHGAITSGSHTIYSIVVAGTDAYFSWAPGY